MMDFSSNTETRGPELSQVTIALLVISSIAVALRCYVRWFITKSFQADDWLMVLSLAVFALTAGFVLAGVRCGLGRHNKSLSQANEIEALKWQSLATASYIVNMAVVKMSIGFFLLRISVHRVYIWILYISMAVIVVWSGGIFLFEIFQCNPVAAQWDFTLLMVNGGTGTCASGDAVVAAGYALSVLAVLSDWLYALLPIFMVWKVRMSLQAKITVILVLSLGVFASIATLIRVRFLIEIGNFEDLLYGATDALIWTLVEPGISIFAASIATLRPLLRALKLTGFSSADDERTTAQGTASGSAWQGVPEARPQELDEFSAAPPRRLNVPQKSSAIPTPRTDELSDDGSEDLIYTRGLRGKSQIPR